MFRPALCLPVLAALTAPALIATEWLTDFNAACARAQQEGKAVLLDFTGSDWCGCCNQLRKTVLDTPEFAAYAQDKFICVEVDMPRTKKQPAALAAQNKVLAQRYNARLFPTVLVISPHGDVLGGFIGARDSVASAAQSLDAAYANLAKVDAARAASGVELARGLMEVYLSLPLEIKDAGATYVAEIEAADPEDATGFRRIAHQQTHQEFMHEVIAAGADYARILELIEARLQVAPEEELPELMRIKGMVLLVSAGTEEDLQAAKDCLQQAVAMHHPNAAAIQAFVDREFQDPAALLARMEEQREATRPAHDAESALNSYISKLLEKGVDLQEELAGIERQLADAPAECRAELLFCKGAILLHLAKSPEESLHAVSILMDAAALMGDTPEGKALRDYVEQMFE